MAASKKVDQVVDEAVEEVVEEAKPAHQGAARPNDTPIEKPKSHFTNTTFADRAKARNKRVDKSDTDAK